MQISIEDGSTNDLSGRTIGHSAQHFVPKMMPLHDFSDIYRTDLGHTPTVPRRDQLRPNLLQ
ncbi:hypothetical protein CWO89_03105 [Bradyrhizobium sp. Leo170]|nr:hypothetical protein CWO89_03105 [Bradyrhizobium sp. Leo170]